MLAPAGWLNRVSTRSCLVTRSTFGLSIFTSVLPAATRSAFESTDRGGFLAVAAIDEDHAARRRLARSRELSWRPVFRAAGRKRPCPPGQVDFLPRQIESRLRRLERRPEN